VKRQYIGKLGKTENGIVVVTAYGVFWYTFPLLFEVSPKKDSNQRAVPYQTRNSRMLMRKLESMGFKFNLVLADSLYGRVVQISFIR